MVVDPIKTAGQIGANRGKIGFADDQGVGECCLAGRLGEAAQVVGAAYRVDQGNDPGQVQAMVEHRVGAQGVQNRRWIGETGSFDYDPVEPSDLSGFAPVQQAA